MYRPPCSTIVDSQPSCSYTTESGWTSRPSCRHHLNEGQQAAQLGRRQRSGHPWKRRRALQQRATVASATLMRDAEQDASQWMTPQDPPPQQAASADNVGLQQPMLYQAATDKVGVLLLNLGGPDRLEDVEKFLFNLFNDPDIIRLPPQARFAQPALAWLISKLRASKSAEGYKAIGGGSPLRRITGEQGEALRAALQRKGQDAAVYVAMRYWYPFTEEALESIKTDGVSRLVVLPLYPQFSISTSGSSLRLLEERFKSDPALVNLKHTVIASWYQRKGYLTAMADLIQKELQRFQRMDEVRIFFSAHGVPVSYVEEAGDPYKEEMEQCVQLIMAELQRRGVDNEHVLAYQSRVGPVKWLQPYTDDTIRELGASGCKSLLAVPISFVSEHIETLEEIDMEYRELAHESGIPGWGRVPALNTNPTFIDDLADAVLEALPYAGSMAGSNPSDSMVPLEQPLGLYNPLGDVQSLLETYDRERRVLPAPVLPWKWGWTRSAEIVNGRVAMLALLVILLLEVSTGQGVLSHWPYNSFKLFQ